MKNRYIIQCECGKILFKKERWVVLDGIELKCPSCGKILKLPEDVILTEIADDTITQEGVSE